MIFNIICDIIYYMFNSLSTFHACLSSQMQALGLEWRNPLPQQHMILKKISQWTRMMLVIMQINFLILMILTQADSPGSINDENLEILAAILKQIPECINKENFDRLSNLLPHMEPVQVATRTVQEAIAVSYY